MQQTTRDARGNGRQGALNARNAPGVAVFDAAYVERLRSGDDETANHFDHHFRRLVRATLWGKFNRQREDDLTDDIMGAAIQSIMQGKPTDATRLAAYIRGICANSIKQAMRCAHGNTVFAELDFDRISDGAKTAELRIQENENAQAVRKVLSSLSRRDRQVLVDLFYHELSREEVCVKHGVTADQLRPILFHAIRRFRKKWRSAGVVDRQTATWKGGRQT